MYFQMKNFLLTAIANKIGVWNGYAETVSRKNNDKFFAWGGLGLKDAEVPISALLQVKTNHRIIGEIINKNFTTYLSVKQAKGISEIRVIDTNYQYSAGIIPWNTLSKASQFNIHVKEKSYNGISFFFRYVFDKSFKFPGVHEIYLGLKPIIETSLYGDPLHGHYSFYVNVQKKLLDRCNDDPKVLAELCRKFSIQ